jgi:predicted Zn-dependent protease with MMP-like domain
VIQVSAESFDRIVAEAIEAIPSLYRQHLENVAFLVEDFPTAEQARKLSLYPNELLFGLYEGVPLPQRGGQTKLLPDKITIFKRPAELVSNSLSELKQHVRHTIWHEVAHYYGLNHERIHALENKPPKGHKL